MRAPFFAGMSKTALERQIQTVIAGVSFGERFTDPLLSDLIVAKHYYCSVHGLRPSEFRKERVPKRAYDFWGCFDGRWHGVSWRQCLYPKNNRDLVIQALRLEASPTTDEYLKAHRVCEGCRKRRAAECHHADPTFEVMADAAIAVLGPPDWTAIYKAFDWWAKAPFRLPEDSPALVLFRREHATARLEALCRECHLTR